MIFCSWVIVLSPFPVPEGRVAVPVRGENRARPRHPLRKATTIVRLSSSYRTEASEGHNFLHSHGIRASAPNSSWPTLFVNPEIGKRRYRWIHHRPMPLPISPPR